jgi:energy-coupling factor transporter ATP-binding protein EcfA2
MYVRLAFAVAAHLEPEILLVDEVLAVGDMGFQRKCLGKMGEVAKEGRTVLFVSHDMAQITSLCKQGLWLDGGVIGYSGIVADTVANYFQSFEDTTRQHQNGGNGFIGWKFLDAISSYTADNTSKVTIQVEVGLKKYYPHGISNLILQTEDGLRISTLTYYGVKLPRGKVALRYPLERLPLVPGKYYLRVELWDPGKPIDITVFPQPMIIVSSDKDTLESDSKKGIVSLKSELEVEQI